MYKAINSYPFYRAVSTMYYMNEKTKKNLILEPLSCVLRIILLQYKDKGTKISVVDNGISYNSPSFAQGLFRSWYGDTREDLHNLCNPILYFTKWYPRDNPFFQVLYSECETGFGILQDVYDKNSTIYHTINHYLAILNGEKEQDIKQRQDQEGGEDGQESTDESITQNPLIHKLQHIWSADEITLVVHLLSLIKETKNGSDVYLRNLEDILEAKETYVHEYIKQVTSSYG